LFIQTTIKITVKMAKKKALMTDTTGGIGPTEAIDPVDEGAMLPYDNVKLNVYPNHH
jgi:hypothetical protein